MAISQMKQVCKPGGLLLISTRSQGFHVHDYPGDFWRFEIEDMKVIFSDCQILRLEKDVETHPGVLLKAAMGERLGANNKLDSLKLYSVQEYVFLKNRLFYQMLKRRVVAKQVDADLIGAEIGAGEGTNLWWVTMLLPLKEYHVVDNFKPYVCDGKAVTVFAQYENRIKGLFHNNKNASVHVMDSVEAAKLFRNKYFDFVYLDANYDEIEADVQAWLPKVKKGGVIGGAGIPLVTDKVKQLLGEITIERNEWWRVCE